jgi:tryptophanyl-tRNA synthetase
MGKGKQLPKSGGVANLLTLVELFQGKEQRKEYEQEYLGKGLKYQGLKNNLAKAIFEEVQPIQERRRFYESKPELVKEILVEGQRYCSTIAHKTLTEVKEKMGLV